MIGALMAAGVAVRTVVLQQATDFADVSEALVIVDTIGGRLAVAAMRTLEASRRVVLLALMSRGAYAMAVFSHRVIAPSQALVDELAREIARDRFIVVRPGQDPVAAGTVVRDGRRVLCVANWSPEKGIDLLLDAIAPLADLHLDLVGDEGEPTYAAEIQRKVRAPDLAGRVRVWGSLDGEELARRYRDASIFALPSRDESYGMALATALAYGLPSVARAIPATVEVAGSAALLVTSGRAAALTTALLTLSTDAALREQLSHAALERARTFPTWTESEARFVAVIREELDAATRAARAPRRDAR